MIAEVSYRLAQLALRAFTPVLAVGEGKLARGLRGRRDAHERLVWWGRSVRDPDRPTVWFHAPSVGEGLQARAVMDALRRRIPECQIAFTHFSPSASALAADLHADIADYLPWDVPSDAGVVLQALAPGLVVFTKTEIWPFTVAAASADEVPVAMIAGTLPPRSSRRRWPTRALLRESWGRLDWLGAVSEEDAAGFVEIGARPEAVHVTGDPGVDSAAQRALAADPRAPFLKPFHEDPRPTLVAGSVWPSDEAALLAAVQRLRGEVPELRLIAVPHEPDEAYVGLLSSALEGMGMATRTLAAVEAAGSVTGVDAVVVDRVGPLAHLYSVGTVAYVGGGFHQAGLHSVLEPAAAGLPVAFGPRHENARAAAGLLRAGAGVAADGGEALARALLDWFQDEDRLHYTGARARGYIDAHLGAAERSAEHLERLMDQETKQRR